MTDIERRYNARVGIMKGLITRWTNQGYNIDVDYTRPKRITEGSIRRVDSMIEEVRRQHDVQSGPVSTKLRQEIAALKALVDSYVDGRSIGTVGRESRRGVPGLSSNNLTVANGNWIKMKLDDYYALADTIDKKERLLNNIKAARADLEDLIEQIVLALYKAQSAEWGGGINGFDGMKGAFSAAFKNALENGVI